MIAVFLVRHGYAPSDAEPLAPDASFRRYLRIRGDRPAVLMDAPPPEDVGPFLRIAAHLRGIGLRAPAILAADEATGLVLEEDLGDDLLSVLLDRGDAPDALLDLAIDALVVMQRAAPPSGRNISAADRARTCCPDRACCAGEFRHQAGSPAHG